MRIGTRKRQEKIEDRRPILKKLRSALQRSFRGSTAKVVCVRGVPEVTGTLGKTSHFDPTQTGFGAAPSR